MNNLQIASDLCEFSIQGVMEGGGSTHQHVIIIIITMVLFYLFIQYYAVLKEISIR